ncbi:MAG: DNA translocase FtsK, partial [Chloroflexaceae bacterium]|nr:DNA translocase FtsK [Chloroflexaceae bacterium]
CSNAQKHRPPRGQPPRLHPATSEPSPPPSRRASQSQRTPPAPTTPPAPAAPSQPVMLEVRQDALEGFEAPTVYRAWPLPSMELLERPGEISITSDEEHRFRSRTIEETLKSFKVEVQVVGVNTGPAVTQFEVQPAVGVKISKITALQRDLALALAAPSIRIEAPIPGKSVVGIEIPNSAISVVTLREVMDSEESDTHKGKLKLPLGKDISGNPIIADMTRMPHLLVAGSTGSGKSVAINAFLCGLLLKHTPEDLKLIMVDPKMVELIVYNHIPHLLSPVVTELERVVPTLKWATREMERRYKVFARYACRNLESYRQLARRRADLEPMPYIVIVIDELADLMMMAPDEVETYICRLAQMARATGIHLIIATQRPSVDVITGLIKANFPSRIAFAVSSQVDSRVILDGPGAEQLLGRGDMLFMAAEASRLVRIQGTYVSDREVEKLVNFWRAATPPELQDAAPAPAALGPSSARAALLDGGKSATPGAEPAATLPEPPVADQPAPHATPSTPLSPSNDSDGGDLRFTPPAGGYLTDAEQETLLPQALVLVRQHRRASAALLQRRLRIGHSKAAQLIDLLEQMGVVGPADEGRSREVLPPQDGASS